MLHINDNDFDKIFNEEMDEVNSQLEQEILFAMVGDVNAGKSSTINKLVGEEVANVGSKPRGLGPDPRHVNA